MQVKDSTRVLQTKPECITNVFVAFYQDFLGTKEINRRKTLRNLLRYGHTLTFITQVELIREYTENDVKKAIFSIGSNKSPGPDGYGSDFYKKAWKVVGNDVTEAVLQFFRNGKLLKQLNATMISLIPKVPAPQSASQFRPISYCNILYKCISKLLRERLKEVLPSLVSDKQATFVTGRSIVHNVLICHDLLRHYNRNTSPKCMMKIDLRKAYDMVS
ncbi:hypothetical protein KY290_037085 [Solanum tuberosum]|uniref:Reverse transcriptase domain-containing protein n=1 Tax=Solanum tuberosum TaxID=4113 RepID=A0ABQ7TYA7_SOLTU|nr:hypothetical protein KY290_037085 [Solanum tuberosum]